MTEFLQQVVNGLTNGAAYSIVALGFGLVFSVMHIVNFAHPQFVVVGAYGAYATVTYITKDIIAAFLIAALLTLVVGLVVERFAIRPTRGRFVLISFVATIGVGTALAYATQRIFGPNPLPVSSPLSGTVAVGGVLIGENQIMVLGIAAAMVIATTYYVERSRWGRASRAVAENHVVASALGVNINLVSVMTVGLSALLAGIAGAGIATAQGTISPFMGDIYGLKSFVAMLVAGNRHMGGIIVIAMSLGVLEALVAGYISSSLRDIVAFGVLVVALYLRPNGLFGSYSHS